MKITKIETIPLTMPYRSGGRGYLGSQSRGRFQEASPQAHFSIVKIHTDEDIVGISETGILAPKNHHLLINDHLGPAIIGMDPFNLVKIHSKMRRIEMHLFETLGPMRYAQTALDIALYDIIGKAVKEPIYKLLGGSVREVIPFEPGYIPGVTTTIEEMVESAKDLYNLGHRSFKMKVGADVDMEVKRIKALREALGDDAKFIVDANQGWTPKTAIKTINKMDRYDLFCVEQPVAFWDIKGLAIVRQNVNSLVMADESIGSPRDALNLVRNEAADAFHVYLNKSPGIYYTMKIATIAEPVGILCYLAGWQTLTRVAECTSGLQ
jgi:L-alanine-DL-glutamate epimerase-like enolase superfamily enzyme